MIPLLLTSEELRELTGRKRRKEQREVLDQWGIKNEVNAAGRLIVGRRAVEEYLTGHHGAAPRRTRPNLEALAK